MKLPEDRMITFSANVKTSQALVHRDVCDVCPSKSYTASLTALSLSRGWVVHAFTRTTAEITDPIITSFKLEDHCQCPSLSKGFTTGQFVLAEPKCSVAKTAGFHNKLISSAVLGAKNAFPPFTVAIDQTQV